MFQKYLYQAEACIWLSILKKKINFSPSDSIPFHLLSKIIFKATKTMAPLASYILGNTTNGCSCTDADMCCDSSPGEGTYPRWARAPATLSPGAPTF